MQQIKGKKAEEDTVLNWVLVIGEIKMSQEVKENIKAILALISMMVMTILLIWCWTYGYVKYKQHPSEYTVTMQKVTRIALTGKGHHVVYFEYEMNGQKQEGRVDYAFSDKVGKRIKIAFDQNMDYIRPELLIGSTMMWTLFTSIVTFMVTFPILMGILMTIIDKMKSIFCGDGT